MEIAASRPQVSVYDPISGNRSDQCALPQVFLTPIRSDLIHEVHTGVAKNRRQPYAVLSQHGPSGRAAGHQNSAHSWGTGRAVSRIPRVSGSGTHRSGQGAVGNMCRGGHMFAPTKVWRKWHQRVNLKMRRIAAASAIAATSLPSLVSARGHKIDDVPELPLVVGAEAEEYSSTKQAVALLKAVGAYSDIARVVKSRALRAGKGKMRGRRFKQRRGPLVIYNEDKGIVKAFRNIPGVDLCSVHCLNILQLAPGSHCGRFVIWTQNAFQSLDKIFGTFKDKSEVKKGFILPRYNILTNTDITRIINSDDVQRVLRPKKENNGMAKKHRKNLLRKKHFADLLEINPYAAKEKEDLAKEVMADE